MTEASCAKCHKQQVYIPKADKLNLAYATFERAGCYACHKTKGFENVKKPGPILTKIDSKLSQDWVKNWIRNPQAVKPTTWMPRFWYNSNNSAPEDAPRNEAEINAIAAYLFANAEHARVRGEESRRTATPSAARRSSSRSAVRAATSSAKDRVRGRAAADLRPAAREHRQQDHLRVDLQLGPRSEALQPGDLHAEPAPDRRAGGRRRDLPGRPQGAGRRHGEGDARRQGHRRRAARLHEERDALRGREGADREDEPGAEAARARAARDQPLRLLQLPRHQGLREGAVDRHRPLGRGQQAGHAPRLRVHHRHPAHLEDGVVRAQAARPARSSTRAACCSRSRSCACRTSTSPTRK